MKKNGFFGYTEKIEKMYDNKDYFAKLVKEDRYQNVNDNILNGTAIDFVIPIEHQTGINVSVSFNDDVDVV